MSCTKRVHSTAAESSVNSRGRVSSCVAGPSGCASLAPAGSGSAPNGPVNFGTLPRHKGPHGLSQLCLSLNLDRTWAMKTLEKSTPTVPCPPEAADPRTEIKFRVAMPPGFVASLK
eukprot:487717-Rhodomonas_salina.3